MADYQLTPAWHVIDTHDQSDPDMSGREMAAATSAADGEAIVAALNSHRGAVEALRPFVEAYDRVGRTFCPSFDGPLDLEAFSAAARLLDRLGGQ